MKLTPFFGPGVVDRRWLATGLAAVVGLCGLGVYLLVLLRLGQLDRSGPAHAEVELDGGTPGTLYLPEASPSGWLLPPPGARAPGVVLLHGYAADRRIMSVMAGRLARNGYAVLAIDLPGHGGNRNRFPVGFGRLDALAATVKAATEFLRASPYVDGSQIAIVGHSMGASAALDAAGRDQELTAVVAISGAVPPGTTPRARNALFLLAAADPAWVRRSVLELASSLGASPQGETDRLHDDIAAGTAVDLRFIDGVHHGTILWSVAATREILSWLEAARGGEQARPRGLASGGLPATLLGLAALLLLLPALGEGIGRLAPAWPPRDALSAPSALLWVAGAAALTLPILGAGEPLASFLALDGAEFVVPQLGLAGLVLLIMRATDGELSRLPASREWLPAMAAGSLGAVLIYVLLCPLGGMLHALSPTPERFVAVLKLVPLLLPFFLGLDLSLRRGSPSRATLMASAGRLVVLGVLVAAGFAGLVRPLLVLMLPAVALLLFLLEILAWRIYARSRNLAAIATLEALVLAWVLAVVLPIRS